MLSLAVVQLFKIVRLYHVTAKIRSFCSRCSVSVGLGIACWNALHLMWFPCKGVCT